jgi:rhamnogalacturonyl hydrolase YesR
MLDPEHAPGPETSGTAFFAYGLMWGVNNGLLDEGTYMPVLDRAWKYLSETALQKDGRVGYVQPIGDRAIPGQVIEPTVRLTLVSAHSFWRHASA